jgi:hypothetical protein
MIVTVRPPGIGLAEDRGAKAREVILRYVRHGRSREPSIWFRSSRNFGKMA